LQKGRLREKEAVLSKGYRWSAVINIQRIEKELIKISRGAERIFPLLHKLYTFPQIVDLVEKSRKAF